MPSYFFDQHADNEILDEKQLTIICVAYKRYHPLITLIESLLSQSLRNFRLIVIHDGFDSEIDHLMSAYKDMYQGEIDYLFTQTRHNDYGHSLREIGLEMAQTEYILITNDDNYYMPNFLKYMFYAVESDTSTKADIVFCDMIHGHNNPGYRRQYPNKLFVTMPLRNYIDMGCFIAKTSLAKAVGFKDKSFAADATYLENILASIEAPLIRKVPLVLFVHN